MAASPRIWLVAVTLFAALNFAARAQTAPPVDEPTTTLPTVEVIGTTPVLGSGIDRDKVPANVRSFSSGDLKTTSQPSLTGTLGERDGSISLNNQQGTPFQPDVQYRGFDASPIFGTPQGLAVYQNGVRINEAFGDTVNWDMVPDFAINRLNVLSANPVFGLNALGGAIALEMKNGFTAPGASLELSGGSFGRINGTAEYGVQSGPFASYIGANGLYESGFRDHSDTSIRQLYADIGAESDLLKVHLSFAGADNVINALGPTPVELLAQSRSSVFTQPQRMTNDLGFLTLTGSYKAADALNLDGNLYYRHFSQRLVDGNTTDVQVCADPTLLCLGDGTTQLFNQQGQPVTNFLNGATPGEIDHTSTDSDGVGGSLQATLSNPILGHDNHFVAGGSLDHGDTRYGATGELGILQNNLLVTGTGVIIDQPDQTLSPVSLDTTNSYYGLYLTDTLDLTTRLSLTLSGRYNLALIRLSDLNGTGLDGDHRYDRFNPAAGFTYKIFPSVTGYAGYAEANRAPSPGELACSDPAHPCALDAFLVSDPNLNQVVTRTYEAGLRGHVDLPDQDGRLTWNFGLFRTDSENDIINVASPLVTGLGFFQNAGNTRRQGIETGAGFKSDRWSAFIDYSLIDATFQSDVTLSSPNNPAADANGNIQVRPGDHLPLLPEHRLKLGADYSVTEEWKVGGSLIVASGQYFVGDESNQNPKLPGYHVVNLRTSYDVGKYVEVFGRIDNVLNEKYANFGAFTSTGQITPSLMLTDPRSESPGPPLAVFVGVRISF